jgi:hypothetical protein
MKNDDSDQERNEPDAEYRFDLAHKVKELSSEKQSIPFAVQLAVMSGIDVPDRPNFDIILMSDFLKSGSQKCVRDRKRKDDRCYSIKGLLLNSGDKFPAKAGN